jgi:hypothetical protein
LDAVATRFAARGDHDWVREEPGLEDAFIFLMGQAEDNFGARTP